MNSKILQCVTVESGLGQKYAFTKKNPQFLFDHYEILTKEGTHEDLILTKFRNDRVKIEDLLKSILKMNGFYRSKEFLKIEVYDKK